jgi:hypothetical protein
MIAIPSTIVRDESGRIRGGVILSWRLLSKGEEP